MITAEQIQTLVDAKLAEGDNFLVELIVKPGNKIIILLDNDKGVSIADCVAMSRHVEFNLDRETEDFELRVSSPGLDQPFKTLRQYQKYLGKQVEVTTKDQKKLSGKLNKVDKEGIELETRAKERLDSKKGKQLVINNINLTHDQIKETKVVVSF
jgi:ribosome maturation factor RimP